MQGAGFEGKWNVNCCYIAVRLWVMLLAGPLFDFSFATLRQLNLNDQISVIWFPLDLFFPQYLLVLFHTSVWTLGQLNVELLILDVL